MEYIKNRLDKLVKLHKTKYVIKKNKRVISTCVYIPGELNYNERSIYYFQGLVKSVETFQEVMNNKGKNSWIYRIYYDKMFDTGIYIPQKKHKPKKHKLTKKQRKKVQKRAKILTKKKRNKAVKMGSMGNEYRYVFNNSVYDLPHKEMDKMYLYDDFLTGRPLTKTFSSHTKIKKRLLENEETFKKLIKLYHLYIKNIKSNKGNKYSNIELIRYDCPSIKEYPDFIGHTSSFGMFLRFCPLLDSDVSMFYSVNSTHALTPQLAHIIKEWDKDNKKEVLAFCYNTPNIKNSASKYIIEIIEKIKKKKDENTPLTTFESRYIEIINGIFNLNILSRTSDENSESKSKSLAEKEIDKIRFGIKLKGKLNFNKIKERKVISSYRIDPEHSFVDKFKKKNKIIYSYCNLLYNKQDSLYGHQLDEAIGGGAFGIKKSFPFITERYSVFIDFILLLVGNKIQLDYGLDELLLKIILLPDIHIHDNKTYLSKIDYIRLYSNIDKKCSSNIFRLVSSETSHIENSDKNKIKVRSGLYNNLITFLPEFFNNSWLVSVDHFDSRAMFVKEDNTKLNNKEDLEITLDKNNLCFNSIFTGYNEPKKLLIIDKKIDKTFKRPNTLIKKYLEDSFQIIYIQEYNLGKIERLLQFIITYYRIKITQPKFIFTKPKKLPSIKSNN